MHRRVLSHFKASKREDPDCIWPTPKKPGIQTCLACMFHYIAPFWLGEITVGAKWWVFLKIKHVWSKFPFFLRKQSTKIGKGEFERFREANKTVHWENGRHFLRCLKVPGVGWSWRCQRGLSKTPCAFALSSCVKSFIPNEVAGPRRRTCRI